MSSMGLTQGHQQLMQALKMHKEGGMERGPLLWKACLAGELCKQQGSSRVLL